MRIMLCREAGGLGDAIRVAFVARSLQEEGHAVSIATLMDYASVYAHILEPGYNIVTVNLQKRRQRGGALDPNEYPYLARYSPEKLVDLFCPAYQEESDLGVECKRSRLDVFASVAGVASKTYRWNITDLEAAEASGFIKATNPTGKPMVAIQPCSSDNRRNWPASSWQYLIDQLFAAGYMVLIFHSRYPAIRDFIGCKKLAGLPISLVAAIIEKCSAAIMPDSGLYHLAHALGVPTLGIFAASPGRVVGRNYGGEIIEPSESQRKTVGCPGVCWGRPAEGSCVSRRDAKDECACPAITAVDKELVVRRAFQMLNERRTPAGEAK